MFQRSHAYEARSRIESFSIKNIMEDEVLDLRGYVEKMFKRRYFEKKEERKNI